MPEKPSLQKKGFRAPRIKMGGEESGKEIYRDFDPRAMDADLLSPRVWFI
jgi:hypothetical protein